MHALITALKAVRGNGINNYLLHYKLYPKKNWSWSIHFIDVDISVEGGGLLFVFLLVKDLMLYVILPISCYLPFSFIISSSFLIRLSYISGDVEVSIVIWLYYGLVYLCRRQCNLIPGVDTWWCGTVTMWTF